MRHVDSGPIAASSLRSDPPTRMGEDPGFTILEQGCMTPPVRGKHPATYTEAALYVADGGWLRQPGILWHDQIQRIEKGDWQLPGDHITLPPGAYDDRMVSDREQVAEAIHHVLSDAYDDFIEEYESNGEDQVGWWRYKNVTGLFDGDGNAEFYLWVTPSAADAHWEIIKSLKAGESVIRCDQRCGVIWNMKRTLSVSMHHVQHKEGYCKGIDVSQEG